MHRVPTAGRFRWVRTLPLVAVLAILVVGVFPVAMGASVPPAPGAGALSGTAPLAPSSSTSTTHLATHQATQSLGSAHPAWSPTGVNLNFYQNASNFSAPPVAEQGCQSFNYTFEIENICSPQAVSPSIVTLANGNVGVGYSLFTNHSGTHTSACVSPSFNAVTERVGFSISQDNGSTYGPIEFLGNETCSYLDAIEPSFATGPTGTIYGAYVEENYSGNQGTYVSASTHYYCTCANRSQDALGFTVSSNNGATFSAPITINSNGWVAKPQVAVYGKSVYVLFENVSNTTTGATIPYGYSYYSDSPIGIQVLYSPDGGVTWKGPYSVPGVIGLSGTYQETGGSIAVSSNGTVAVSYFTNDSCVENDYAYCESYGDDLVVSTSTTNASTFKGPFTVFQSAGSSSGYYLDYLLAGNFQALPESSVAFSADGSTVYVAWTSPYNNTRLNGLPWQPYSGYEDGGAFEATGPVSGAAWTLSLLDAGPEQYDEQYDYSPAIGVSGTSIYVTYTLNNESYCGFGNPCSYLGGSYAQAIFVSTTGTTWSGPSYPTFEKFGSGTYATSESFPGLGSAVGFTSSGSPLFGYSLPQGQVDTYAYTSIEIVNETLPTLLYVAQPYSGPTVTVNVSEANLLPGTAWSLQINGAEIDVPAGTTNFTLSGVAVGQTLLVSATQLDAAYAEIAFPVVAIAGTTGTSGAAQFFANDSIFVNYTYEFGLSVNFEPNNPFEAEVEIDYNGFFYYYEVAYYCFGTCYSMAFPWYFPANTTITLTTYGEPAGASFWSGYGPGNYTGTGSEANITMNGPINETAWFTTVSTYNITVQAPTLASTSTFHFDFAGTSYSAAGGSIVNVSNVVTGAHDLTNVWATSSTAGWEYIGNYGAAHPILVPNVLNVNLAFAAIDLSAPTGQVTFHAQGLTSGTVWQFAFNGTTYSSSTPWINVTTHPGDFSTVAFPVVSADASTGYAPSGVPSLWSVTTGSTYSVNFTQAYKVVSIAGTGGTVTGSNAQWLSNGASVSFSATPKAGYGFGGWTGTGTGSYTGSSPWANFTVGGPINEFASFLPLSNYRFNITFQETGLSPGTWWTVNLGGVGYSSNQATFTVGNLPGCGSPGATLNLSVPYAYAGGELTRFVPTASLPRTTCASNGIMHETFGAQYFLTLQATPGGYAEATIGASSTTTGIWVAQGATVSLSEFSQPGYSFLGWNGTGQGEYTGASSVQTIVLTGPVTEVAAFAIPIIPQAPRYTVDFHLSIALSSGTAWSVSLGGTNFTSTGSDLIVGGLTAGQYSLTVPSATAPSGTTRYTGVGNPTSVSVIHNATVGISFSTSYWVQISKSQGGSVATQSGWATSGSTILLNATPYDGYAFVSWTGAGVSSYSGSLSQQSVRVTAPITEVATFAPVGGSGGSTTTTGASSLWTAPTTWIGLGIVGLLLGLVVGLLVGRRNGRSPPPSDAPAADASAAPADEPVSTSEAPQ